MGQHIEGLRERAAFLQQKQKSDPMDALQKLAGNAKFTSDQLQEYASEVYAAAQEIVAKEKNSIRPHCPKCDFGVDYSATCPEGWIRNGSACNATSGDSLCQKKPKVHIYRGQAKFCSLV